MNKNKTLDLQVSDALLVIDMQVDFLPGGRMAVKDGEEIIPGINALAPQFKHVVLTSDWHPPEHTSFASAHPGKRALTDSVPGPYGELPLWPDHCVQDTQGAEITPKLRILQSELLFRKGREKTIENLSVFFDGDRQTPTGLAAYLRERGIKRIFFCGLALDVCVGSSAIDAAQIGFASYVLEDLTRATEMPLLLSQVNKGFADSKVRLCSSSSLGLAPSFDTNG